MAKEIDYFIAVNKSTKPIIIEDRMGDNVVEVKLNPHAVMEFHRDTEFPKVEGLEVTPVYKEVPKKPKKKTKKRTRKRK